MNHPQVSPTILDQSLHCLDPRATAEQRLAVLQQVVEYWHGPLRPDDGFSEQDLKNIPIPTPLHRWFRLGGRRTSILSGQNKLFGPSELELDPDGRILFYVENQGVYIWSTTVEGDDPQVWGRFNEADASWTEEGMTLSEFLIGACLFQAVMAAPFGATAAWANQKTLDRIASFISQLPLVPWRWPAFPSRFYVRNGSFMFAGPNNENQGNNAFSIFVGAKTAQPLAFLKQIVDEGWEYTALE